ncbi:DrmB family protein [Blastococcus sp. SYSU D00669]
MRSLRLSQTVSPFGVGAILDVLGESLMGTDISEWPYEHTVRVECKRLEDRLGVKELRSPPSSPSEPSSRAPGLRYQRFPRWLFCQNCRRMHRSSMYEEDGKPPVCAACQGHLVPMRFIVVCTRRGHAMDVPWDIWAHSEYESEDQRKCQNRKLRFETREGGSQGLASLVIRCETCKARRDLGDLTAKDSLKRIGVRCNGKQPWQTGGGFAPCDERVEVVQRGATNVTMAEVTTALDIPEPAKPPRDYVAEIRQHRNFGDVASAPNGPRAAVLIGLIADDLGVSEELVLQVAQEGTVSFDELLETRAGLLADEWSAFQQVGDDPDERTGSRDFVISPSTIVKSARNAVEQELSDLVDDVALVHRLREVRVLHGFRRYALDADLVPVDLGPRIRERWLPAVESFGEGIFLSFDQDAVAHWENEPEVLDRAAKLEKRRQESLLGSRLTTVSPRFLLVHTFAHLLMRQLAFTCGYSAASLRERVYASEGPAGQAGLLVYTAAGDAEGTLGGLVRQGEEPRLARSVVAALESAAWCSADPVCRESQGQGLNSLNLAACHGCSLVAETSCQNSNVLLDRVLVVGDDHTPGFFGELVTAIREEAVRRVG